MVLNKQYTQSGVPQFTPRKGLAIGRGLSHIAPMKTAMLLVAAAVLVPTMLHAQSLQFKNVTPGIYCRFSPDCHVASIDRKSSATVTNLAVSCILRSRSFAAANAGGAYGGSADVYGYEYQVTLNNDGENGTNFVAIKSLALNFGYVETFAFGNHASNQVWVVTDGGTGSVAPTSAAFSGTNVVFNFSPPLFLGTLTNKTVSTYSFGMMSSYKPRVTSAVLAGFTQTPPDEMQPFELTLDARTP